MLGLIKYLCKHLDCMQCLMSTGRTSLPNFHGVCDLTVLAPVAQGVPFSLKFCRVRRAALIYERCQNSLQILSQKFTCTCTAYHRENEDGDYVQVMCACMHQNHDRNCVGTCLLWSSFIWSCICVVIPFNSTPKSFAPMVKCSTSRLEGDLSHWGDG